VTLDVLPELTPLNALTSALDDALRHSNVPSVSLDTHGLPMKLIDATSCSSVHSISALGFTGLRVVLMTPQWSCEPLDENYAP
jgi:hypothetical protein